ncbi:MAG: adenosylhomocysteinase [Pyramidobacter porci]|uniref:adenosylhomocysteinase n=1 Tax=Pyramidobacter porci TaxID=2605789 RepID=UPI002A74C8D4|nr:adenosylhomocysteinase [Pyramidobacter porci]MDY2649041.1 adenosylhomocysteinase [Pyramidobacter porci]
MDYKIADLSLAPGGHAKMDWAWRSMPVLNALKARYAASQPLKGVKLAACLHLEAKTACLLRTFKDLGAEVRAAGSNPLSTQDDVCAALVDAGVSVFSRHAMSGEEYHCYLRDTLAFGPSVITDDGADLVATLLSDMKDLIPAVKGASEETTSGVKRLKAMERQGILPFPVISVNDAHSKYLFDNRYGTGQSVWDGFMRTTNILVAGKTVVIAGYGWCGRGAAMRARALGARVIVTELDPHRAFEAVMDGNELMTMAQAAPLGDIFLTFTGNTHVIRAEHFQLMKDNAIMGNAGHFDVEINKRELAALAVKHKLARTNIETFTMPDGRRLNLLGEGRLVNLACGDGHPIEIMDLSFALQLESAIYVNEHGRALKAGLMDVPEEIDAAVMETKLASMGLSLERLTEEQRAYMADWHED